MFELFLWQPTLLDHSIYIIREQRVMLDEDLAKLYGVETKVLNQAIRRNKDRFPEGFMFKLSVTKYKNLKSQIVTSSFGGRRYMPFVI
ncbi:MAG: ORF6N domain-containing protein [bacterium]|nr:ORF6N domain-containing protein [bacterium]